MKGEGRQLHFAKTNPIVAYIEVCSSRLLIKKTNPVFVAGRYSVANLTKLMTRPGIRSEPPRIPWRYAKRPRNLRHMKE